MVMSPGCFLYIEIDEICSYMIAYGLASCGVRGVLPEKVRPVAKDSSSRSLVGDEAYDKHLSVIDYLDKPSDGFMLRYAFQSEAGADSEHNPVHYPVAERGVYLAAYQRLAEMPDYGLHPFPVAVVPEEQHDRMS